jgi:LPS sulfotransferase NodH
MRIIEYRPDCDDWVVLLRFVLYRTYKRLQMYLRLFFCPRHDASLVFIITCPRTGSNLLGGYLASLPDVQVFYEIFNHRLVDGLLPFRYPRSVIYHHIKLLSAGARKKISVMKIFFRDLELKGLSIIDLKQAFPQAKWIVLYRESLAEQYVSDMTAQRTGVWSRYVKPYPAGQPADPPSDPQIQVNPQDFQQYCGKIRKWYAEIAQAGITAQQRMDLAYEELVSISPSDLGQHLASFLGVPPRPVNSWTLKQSLLPLPARVANWPEVEELLSSALARFDPAVISGS